MVSSIFIIYKCCGICFVYFIIKRVKWKIEEKENAEDVEKNVMELIAGSVIVIKDIQLFH